MWWCDLIGVGAPKSEVKVMQGYHRARQYRMHLAGPGKEKRAGAAGLPTSGTYDPPMTGWLLSVLPFRAPQSRPGHGNNTPVPVARRNNGGAAPPGTMIWPGLFAGQRPPGADRTVAEKRQAKIFRIGTGSIRKKSRNQRGWPEAVRISCQVMIPGIAHPSPGRTPGAPRLRSAARNQGRTPTTRRLSWV